MTSLLAISRKRPVRKALAAFLGGMAVVLVVTMIGPVRNLIQRADQGVADEIQRLTKGPAERDDVVLLGIDEASMTGTDLDPEEVENNLILSKMGARFPWDRTVWAAAIDRLADAGARLIVIDLVFSEESFPQSDQDLAEAIGRHRDKVVLVSAFAEAGANSKEHWVDTLTEPLPDFFGPGPDDTRCGFSNFNPDADGVIRSAVYQTTRQEMNGKPRHPSETPVLSLAAEMLRAMGKPVPDGRRELRMAVKPGDHVRNTYFPRSFRTIFVPKDWKMNYDDGRFFKDKIVMIGPVAPRLQDLHATPLGVISGPQLHLQAFTCGMEGAFFHRYESNARVAMWIGLGAVLLAMAWCAVTQRPIISTCGALGIAIGIILCAYITGTSLFWLVPVVMAVFTFLVGWGLAQTYDLVTERLERGRLHREFRRFVSRDVADTLVRDPEVYRTVAGGRRRRVVVLFSDIRGFTSRSEDTDPTELVLQLNEYLSRMVAIVFKHSGTLDKFIGDAVMAHWGALEDGKPEEHARQAVSAARDMITGLAELNVKWAAEGRVPFQIGIGLHLGDVLAGEIGSVERTEFGVIGDAVNLASRIEGMTKYFAVPLLVSGAVMEGIEAGSGLRRVGRIRVKGRHEPVDLFSPSRGTELDARFAEALEFFEKGDFAKAAELFLEIHRLDEEDGAASRLSKWAGDYAVEPPTDWDGTVIMDSK